MNIEKIQHKYFAKTTIEEDQPVLDFLKKLNSGSHYNYLEAGAGLGRFAKLVKNNFRNLNVSCLEINEQLHKDLIATGLKSFLGSIRKMPFQNNSFDIVHCSHVIEHFGYPEITEVLDELFRVVKTNGFVTIRSPFMRPTFYNDIDHVRPYPPKTILQYFGNKQQQKTAKAQIELVKEFRRPEPWQIGLNIRGINRLNFLIKMFWSKYGWPNGESSGYVAIFKKL